MDRQQAIGQLQACGFHVRERKWQEGDAILVAAFLDEEHEIKLFRYAEYLIPDKCGAWRVTDLGFRKSSGDDRTFPSLAEAVAAITELMREIIAEEETKKR